MSGRWLLRLLPFALIVVAGPTVRPITGSTTSGRFHRPESNWRTPIARQLQDGVDALGKEIEASAQSRSRPSPTCWLCCRTCRFMTRRFAGHWRTTSSSTSREVAVAKKLLAQGHGAGRRSCARGRRPGTRRPGWSFGAMSRRSTARFSLMGWSCRRRISRTRRIGSGSMSGATAGARR